MNVDIMNWTLPGAAGETILGNTHLPATTPRAAAIIVHGFLGYKDYGFFPTIADTLAITASRRTGSTSPTRA